MGDDDIIGRLIDALAQSKIALHQSEVALKMAQEALVEVRAMKGSTHQVQYVNTDVMGQIRESVPEYMPGDEIPDKPLASFDLGKQLASQDEFEDDLEEADENEVG